jgi:hypothetical protein
MNVERGLRRIVVIVSCAVAAHSASRIASEAHAHPFPPGRPSRPRAGAGRPKAALRGDSQLWLGSRSCLLKPLRPSPHGQGLPNIAVSPKRACSERSGCCKQRRTAGPQGGGKLLRNDRPYRGVPVYLRRGPGGRGANLRGV